MQSRKEETFPAILREKDWPSFLASARSSGSWLRSVSGLSLSSTRKMVWGFAPSYRMQHPPVAGSGLDGADPFQLQEPAFNAAGLVMVEHAAAAAHPEPAGRMVDNLIVHRFGKMKRGNALLRAFPPLEAARSAGGEGNGLPQYDDEQ